MPVSVNKAENGDPPGDHDLEEIDIAEEELIDAYLRGELSAEERKLLEKGLRSSPQLVERLHFARLLANAADRSAEDEVASYQPSLPARKSWWPFGLTWSHRPAFNLAFAAFVLIIVVGAVAVFAGWIGLRRESQQLAQQREEFERQKLDLQKSVAEQRLATDQIRAQLNEAQQRHDADQQLIEELRQAQSPTSPTIATLFLLPVSRGSEKENELRPAAGTSRIRLQLAVDSIDYRSFLIEVKNSQDQVIFHPKVSAPRSGKIVTVTIPTQVLRPGAYNLQLSGLSPEGTSELVGNYSFRIINSKQ